MLISESPFFVSQVPLIYMVGGIVFCVFQNTLFLVFMKIIITFFMFFIKGGIISSSYRMVYSDFKIIFFFVTCFCVWAR